MHLRAAGGGLHMQDLGLSAYGFLGRNKTVFQHAFNNVLLANARPARVLNRVVRRRCLGQTGEHRGLGNADIFQGLAEIGFAGSGKSVGTISQKNLVHIDFQNLVFAEVMFEFKSQQYLVNFAGKGFFG